MVFNRPRLATDEGHVFSYRVNFELLSVAEQRRRRRQQQGQQGQRGVILRATLMRRQWELRPASRGAEVQVVDGEGVVGFFPTLVAKDDDDDEKSASAAAAATTATTTPARSATAPAWPALRCSRRRQARGASFSARPRLGILWRPLPFPCRVYEDGSTGSRRGPRGDV